MDILYYIPEPVWLVILAELPLEDRKRARLVCRAWRDWTPFALWVPIEEAYRYEESVFCIFARRDSPYTVGHHLNSKYLDLVWWGNNISDNELLALSFRADVLILSYFGRLNTTTYIKLLERNPYLEIHFEYTGKTLTLESCLVSWDCEGVLIYLRDHNLGLFRRRDKKEVADILLGRVQSNGQRLLKAFYDSLPDK